MKFLILFCLMTTIILGKSRSSVPMLPLLPGVPIEKVEETEDGMVTTRRLLSTGSLETRLEADVVVPLEIISDIEVKALIVDDENLEVPFEVELNKKPERAGIYRLNFSKTALDIDDDGVIDTEIFASQNIDSKIIKDNYVKITGKNISKEGTHRKRVYITVEVDN
ncbi:hypothetical protein [Cetobacterium sp.]|uniref:hypothetical protein n=1 Tax=Cetobacterium sp. TaxID=2071632 RepID=UPI003F405448